MGTSLGVSVGASVGSSVGVFVGCSVGACVGGVVHCPHFAGHKSVTPVMSHVVDTSPQMDGSR